MKAQKAQNGTLHGGHCGWVAGESTPDVDLELGRWTSAIIGAQCCSLHEKEVKSEAP